MLPAALQACSCGTMQHTVNVAHSHASRFTRQEACSCIEQPIATGVAYSCRLCIDSGGVLMSDAVRIGGGRHASIGHSCSAAFPRGPRMHFYGDWPCTAARTCSPEHQRELATQPAGAVARTGKEVGPKYDWGPWRPKKLTRWVTPSGLTGGQLASIHEQALVPPWSWQGRTTEDRRGISFTLDLPRPLEMA